MPKHADGQVEVVVESRELDSEQRTRTVRLVEAPATEADQRELLRQAVAELEPKVELRTFAAGAATFVGHRKLVIASFAAGTPRSTGSGDKLTGVEADDQSEQSPLFETPKAA